jgi:hypothetical protein
VISASSGQSESGTNAAMRPSTRDLFCMNSFDKDDLAGNKQTQAFDPPLIHEEEIEHSADDDREAEESAEEKAPAEKKADKERSDVVAKEAMLRVTGGVL